ncbi:helix-turn-helix domain-containing protein [Microbispora triticiradicis]|uniref:helix-turn-helix domain-containing protein n=1 Tax=Microbispora triticiradicis TaxID=2200763 RepID=UPI001AD6FEE8|nr:helix-turn-helix domain-containing protein [Microbispora triticiradicis]MBO4269688.1 helix-turn-helix domain-containing protein [Microbispora triticiradicis]
MHPRETVDRALRLSALGYNDRQVAAFCGVSLGAVQKWRTGARRAREDQDRRRNTNCPLCHGRALDRRSYAYLLGLYLGDGHIVLCRKRVYRLSIFCGDTWPGLIAAAAQALAAVMPTSSVSRRQHKGCTEVKSFSTHWACLFPQHGPGKKHQRAIVLAGWQEEIVAEHPGLFARGLIHSDGYRGTNRVRRPVGGEDKWYEYPRYLFKNESADILRLYGETLDRLGVEWRHNKPNEISVARRDAVARLDRFVGPKY